MSIITGRIVRTATAGGGAVIPVPNPGQVVANVTALRALTNADGQTPGAVMAQYGNVATVGGGVFAWSATAATDNGVTRFNAGGFGSSSAGWRLVSRQFSADGAGADPTGATDSAAAINRAIVACNASGGGQVVFGPGTYLYASELTLLDNVELVGAGIGATTLTTVGFAGTAGTAFPNAATMYGAGSYTTLDGLAGNVVQGATSITLSSDKSGLLAAGDWFFLYDTTDSSFSAARTYYRAGEFCQVRSVSGAAITLVQPTRASYTAGPTIKAYRLNPLRTAIRGMSVRGFSTTDLVSLIGVKYAAKCDFADLDLRGTDYAQLIYTCAVGMNFRNIRVFDVTAAAGYNYGVVGCNVQHVRVTDCDITVSRHAMDWGGGDFVGAVPNRDCQVSDSQLRNNRIGGVGAAQMHGNSEHISYRNCTITGAYLAGDHNGYENCRIYSGTVNNEAVYVTEPLGFDFWVKGCKVIATGDVDASTGLLVMQGATTIARTGETFRVSATEFLMGPFTGRPWRLQNASGSTALLNVEFSDVLATADAADAANGALITNGSGLAFQRLSMSDVTLQNINLDLTGSNLKTLTLDNVKTLDGAGFGVTLTANASAAWASQYVRIHDCVATGHQSTGFSLVGQDITFSILDMRDNTATDNAGTPLGTGADSSIAASEWLKASFQGNTLGDTRAVQKQLYCLVTSDITKVSVAGNQDVGSSPLPNNITASGSKSFDIVTPLRVLNRANTVLLEYDTETDQFGIHGMKSAQSTIVGSRDNNTALLALNNALAAMGIIVDHTVARGGVATAPVVAVVAHAATSSHL